MVDHSLFAGHYCYDRSMLLLLPPGRDCNCMNTGLPNMPNRAGSQCRKTPGAQAVPASLLLCTGRQGLLLLLLLLLLLQGGCSCHSQCGLSHQP
jgi:hypothetical protein